MFQNIFYFIYQFSTCKIKENLIEEEKPFPDHVYSKYS